MTTIARALHRWADKVEAERTPPVTYTITTAHGTTGPFIVIEVTR